MKHLICILSLVICSSANMVFSQIYFGGVVGTARSKTFKQYAQELNAQPGTTTELKNFNFAYGYTWGIEIPFLGPGVQSGFRFQKLNSSANYVNSQSGEIEYNLTQKQYIIPVVIPNYQDLGNWGVFYTGFQFPLGISNTNIEQKIFQTNGNTVIRNFNNIQMNFGVQLQWALYLKKTGLGIAMRFGHLGSLLPIKEFNNDLSNYEGGPINLEYSYKDEKQNVKADNRNLTFEFSLQWHFILAMTE